MNRKTNKKFKTGIEVEFLPGNQYQFQVLHVPVDAHLQFERGKWILDIFDSREPDADKAHKRSIDFPQETDKEKVPWEDVFGELCH